MAKRILHISPSFNYSCGVSRYVFNLLSHYSKQSEYTIYFITNGGDALSKLDAIGIKPVIIPFDSGIINAFHFISNIIFLIRYCRKHKIDIIHSHHRYLELISYIAGKLLNIATITTVHSLVSGFRYISYQSDFIIAVSKAISNSLIENFKIDKQKIITLYNYLLPFGSVSNSQIIQLKNSLGINNSAKILLFAGRISYVKGCDILVKAFIQFKRQYKNIKLIMIGKVCDMEIMELIKDEAILLLSPEGSIEAYYKLCDLVILPSRTESLGYLMLEAGITRKPFIGSEIDGIAEFIEHKSNGLLFKSESVDELVKCISYILCNPRESELMAQNLFLKVKEVCSEEKYIDSLERVYKHFRAGI